MASAVTLGTARYVLPGEDTIYLKPDTMQVPTANSLFALKNSCIYLNESGTLEEIDTVDDRIDTGSLRTLYNKAVSIGPGGTGSRKITTVLVKYGIHNNNLIIYYKPECLAWDYTTSCKGVVYNCYSNHHPFDSVYYYYTTGGFVAAGYKLQFQPDSTNYVTNIRIKLHKNSPSVSNFNWATDSTGSTRCITFPFQEIYAVLKDNPAIDTIKVSNIACQVLVSSSSASPYIKESVIFGPKNFNQIGGTGIFFNVYADLGSICPPNCKEILYQL